MDKRSSKENKRSIAVVIVVHAGVGVVGNVKRADII